jgi:hypothetical protein
MATIQQAIELAAAPSDDHRDIRVERPEDPTQGPDRQAVEAPSLQPMNRLAAHPGPCSDVVLAQPKPLSKDASDPSDPDVIHRR